MLNCKIYYLDTDFIKINEQENGNRIIIPVKFLKKYFSDSYFVTNKDIIFDRNIIKDYIKEIYSEKYLDSIEYFNFNNLNKGYYDNNLDLTITTNTYNEIILSNALILQAFYDVYNKTNKYAYCLVRPPSHHASKDDPSGFCYVNNTFLIARYAVLYGGFKKVLILDYDLHHGDGTEKLCKEFNSNTDIDNLIHFISLHYYRPAEHFFPRTGKAIKTKDITNYNVKKHSNDEDIEYLMEEIYSKISEEKYDLIIISNGFDAHKDDLYETIDLTNDYYRNVANKLKQFDVPLMYILEGGYNPDVIAECSKEILQELNNNNDVECDNTFHNFI